MMKLLFILLFSIPLSILSEYWLIQFLFLILSFMYIMKFSYNYQWIEISYMFGWDLLSFSLVLLSLWICSLMIMASNYLN